jgi:hypothetical protein
VTSKKHKGELKVAMMLLAVFVGQIPSPTFAWLGACSRIIEGPYHEIGGCECEDGHCGSSWEWYKIDYCENNV